MASKIIIRGGNPLCGRISISGMKNAALPILFATVLVRGVCVLENIPEVDDIAISLEILQQMGAKVSFRKRNTVHIDTAGLQQGTSPYELVNKLRGSTYLLGAELGRFGKASVGSPGGCNFGSRPLDQHMKGFEVLGAFETRDGGYIYLDAPDGLHGGSVYFDVASVGATVNVMLAAVLADGLTVIDNAAREPHIVDLANFLNSCGANITGAGTSVIKIRGVEELHACTYTIIPDMIEAGTYMVAAAITGGCLQIDSVIPKHVESITAKLCEMGVDVEEGDDYVIVRGTDTLLKNVNIKTLPYPGFPTDMHPQFAPLLCLADGVSCIQEGIWENRFRYVDELRKMGASIRLDSHTATFMGVERLSGAPVEAVDLRAGAAMVVAGLAAEGVTEISGIQYIKRGYVDIVGKLQSLGADIEEVTYSDFIPMHRIN
ncbi:MAG: UDP-N-acetylglucosamine 1-carboxyvinyltransferase [Ruminococcaceae bacterium]|nr:UDP-N-acetylglucosamine 1-carboxyvinyltransferase [Oscillospiraceae bacterium]